MSTHTVMVWGEPHTISVDREYKTVWIASGSYKGETITTKDQSQGAAIKRWREAAQYRGG